MYSSYLFSATGRVLYFPIKGSCVQKERNCPAFKREYPWNPYKFPKVCNQLVNKPCPKCDNNGDIIKCPKCNDPVQNGVEHYCNTTGYTFNNNLGHGRRNQHREDHELKEYYGTNRQYNNQTHNSKCVNKPYMKENFAEGFNQGHTDINEIGYDDGVYDMYDVDQRYIAEGQFNKGARVMWQNKNAFKSLVALTQMFGKPDILEPRRGGLAMWNARTLSHQKCFGMRCCLAKMVVKDESITHNCPKPHRDHTYTYVKVHLSPEMYANVTKLSGSVGYDPLQKMLYARCDSLEANSATLSLATDVNNGKVTIEEIRAGGLYAKAIIVAKSNPKAAQAMYKNLCKNLAEQPGNLDHTGHYEGAFDKQCNAPGTPVVAKNVEVGPAETQPAMIEQAPQMEAAIEEGFGRRLWR
jgi:hypothetical protein